MPRTPGAINWTAEETKQLMDLVFEKREYLRPILRANMIKSIWGEFVREFETERTVKQLKTKWDSMCSACGNDLGLSET